MNLLPRYDPAPALAAFRGALCEAAKAAGGGIHPGMTFFVREPGRLLDGQAAPGTGNFILIQASGGPDIDSLESLRASIGQAAVEVQHVLNSPFDMASLAGGTSETWPFD